MTAASREREVLGGGSFPSRSPDAERAHRYAVHLLAEAETPGCRSRARALGSMAAEHLQIAVRALTGDTR